MNVKQVIAGGMMAMAMGTLAQTAPTIVSSQMRAFDSAVIDVVHKVISDKPTVNVREGGVNKVRRG